MHKLTAALILFLSFAAGPTPAGAEEPLPVVASFSIIGDMAKQVGGETVSVTTLVGPDADAHAYRPKTADSKALAKSRIVFMNGLGFEGWMDRMIKSSGFKGDAVVVSKGIVPRQLDEENASDPHAWQNVANARIYVNNIAAALIKAMPEKAAYIKIRADKYSAEIAVMDKAIQAAIARIPEKNRKIITSHDAFGYFGKAYGVKFLAPVGISTESQPSAANVAKLIKQIKAENVKTIFVENMSSPKLIKRISKESGAKMGGELYADALSSANGPAPTYLDMMRHNLILIKGAMIENGN